MKADRRFRVLITSPSLRDRSLMRRSRAETLELYQALNVSGGEQKFFQRYDPRVSDKHPGQGWITVTSAARAS